MPARKRTKRSAAPLVPWEEVPAQVNVLDWRQRASAFGLNPATTEAGDEDEP